MAFFHFIYLFLYIIFSNNLFFLLTDLSPIFNRVEDGLSGHNTMALLQGYMKLCEIPSSVICWPKISDLYVGIIIEASVFFSSRP